MPQPTEQADAFIQSLRDRFVAGGLDPEAEQPMRIQVSSRVVYREGDTSKLTEADMTIIEAALNADPATENSGPSSVGKAVSIDLGGERVFRYKNGVEIDTYKPIEVAQAAFSPIAPGRQSIADALRPDQIAQLQAMGAALEAQHPGGEEASFYELVIDDVSNHFYELPKSAAIETACDEYLQLQAQEAAIEGEPLLDLANSDLDFDEEPYFDPELALTEVEVDLDLSEFDLEPMPSVASADVETTDALIDESIAAVDAQSSPEFSPATVEVEPVSLPTSAKLPAAAIAWARLADKLPEASKEWLTQASEKFAAVADSGFGREVQEKGAEAAKTAWTQLSNLGEQGRNRAIADSVVALTKEFGQFQGQGNQQRWVYEAESFRVEVKGTNAYTVSDHEGNKLYSFKSSWRGPAQVENNLKPMQQFDLVRARAKLTAAKTWETAKTPVDRTQQLADRLGNLAPQGTRDRLVEMRDRQAASLAETLATSKEAVRTAAGSFFDGKPFKAFKSAATETVGLLREGIEGRVLRQEADGGIQSRLGLRDLHLVGQIQQKVDQSMAAVAGATKSRTHER